ncbi:MAG: outer membrane protein assembly factor BamD [Thermodesulfobacteriota bacterium]|nr:outer membrane protein assembly factor BamD [Thermodesulfobacteriota bacterium]
MMPPARPLRWIPQLLAGICILLLLNGCAVWHSIFGDEENLTPAELMTQGMEEFNDGDFEAAAEIFQKIKDRYPYSKFATRAELKMADAQYEKGLFDEAYDSYTEFEKLHPKNPDVPYVMFQKGMCNFRRVSTIDRDQSYTREAKEVFERLIKMYRKSPYAERARRKVRECYIKLAEHEVYVGDYYFKMGKYRPALDRYLYLIEHYPDVGQYYSALEKVKICKEKIAEQKDEDMSWWGRLKSSIFD